MGHLGEAMADVTVDPNPLDSSEPLIKSDPEGDEGEDASLDSIHDGLDFESNMNKVMLPMVLIFIGIGWLCFTLLEDMSALDGLYVTFVTITTVGYGDISPSKTATKIFFMFWILFGLSIVASGLGMFVVYLGQIGEATDEDEDTTMLQHAVNAIDRAISSTVRKLLWEILVLGILVTIGAIWVSFVEDFDAVDSMYWSVQTLTTVGYGDMELKRRGSKIFASLFVLLGVCRTAVGLATIASLWVEHDQAAKVQQMVDHGVTRQMIHVIDKDKKGYVDKNEFLQYMLVKLDKVDHETLDAITNMFEALDADGGGTLGP